MADLGWSLQIFMEITNHPDANCTTDFFFSQIFNLKNV